MTRSSEIALTLDNAADFLSNNSMKDIAEVVHQAAALLRDHMTPADIYARLKAIAATLPKGAHVDIGMAAHRGGKIEFSCYPFGLCKEPYTCIRSDNYQDGFAKLEAYVAAGNWVDDELAKLEAKYAKEREQLLAKLSPKSDAAE